MKISKTKIAICLAGAIAIAGMFGVKYETQAEENGNNEVSIKETVEYIPNTELEENERIDKVFGESAPTMDGYFFGGWYQDISGKKVPIKTEQEKNVARLTDKVWNSKGSTWSSGTSDRSKTFFGDTVAKDVEFNGETTITMNFAEVQTIRALMIYNSSDVNKAFDEIKRIEFVCADGSVKYINQLGFDFTANTYTLAKYQGVTTGDDKFICGASVAEFNELQVTEIRITVKPGAEKTSVALGEIVVLGKN